MAGLQLAVLGSTGRWDGSQGPGYWRKRPTMREAIATQIRSRGGNMQAADQLSVLENQVEPTSGAADWLSKLIEHLQPEIAAASNDVFPSARLDSDLAGVALGHLATDAEYCKALQKSLSKALPLEAISMAGDYTPSRASGMLIPVSKSVVQLSAADHDMKDTLIGMLQSLREERALLEGSYAAMEQEVIGLRNAVVVAQDKAAPSAKPSETEEGKAASQGKAATQEAGTKAGPGTTVAGATSSDLSKAKEELKEAETKLQDIGKQRRGVYSTQLQIVQQLKSLEPAVRPSAEVVKAFMHPTLGRLCTAHDCIVLKVFAIMDVVYGIATALQQVKFSELRQGKGAGISADEGVREFAARIRMHMQSSLDIDPKLAHVQFFAGLADQTIANSAKAAMQQDRNCAMDLETATEQVLLIEVRELEDLRLRAANGDSAAATELKRRASLGAKKPTKDPKPPVPPPKKYNPDPNHPEGKCRLPGHDTEPGHMNRHCKKGGSMNSVYAAMFAAALASPQPASSSSQVEPALAALHQTAAAQSQEIELLRIQLANALKLNPSSFSGKNFAGKVPPTASGVKCTICGFPSGHPNGFCYYEYPEKNPTWAPSTNAKPELIAQWTLRRQQRNLPPLAPRPPPQQRQAPTANLVYPVVPPAPPLPPPPPVPRLPAPETVVNVAQYANTGGVATLSAIAKMDIPFTGNQTVIAGAAMPRSFLQFPPSTPAPPSVPRADGAADVSTTGVVSEDGQVGDASGNKRSARGSQVGVAKKLRFVDEKDMHAAVQAPNTMEMQAMLAELEHSQLVPCLDTFVNLSAAAGVSMQLPDGRWQLPGLMITDSGATFGVAFDASCKAIGLPYAMCGVSLVLADGSQVRILGMTSPIKLVFARGTAFERSIMYRFLVLPGEGKHYKWLLAKNALLELGAYVDPAEAAFYYRTGLDNRSPKHALPVRCAVPIEQADPADCLHMLQPVVAAVLPTQEPAAEAAAGHFCA